MAGDGKGGAGGSKAGGKAGNGSAGNSLQNYVLKDPEAFARNLARIVEQAGHAAAAWVAPREEGRR